MTLQEYEAKYQALLEEIMATRRGEFNSKQELEDKINHNAQRNLFRPDPNKSALEEEIMGKILAATRILRPIDMERFRNVAAQQQQYSRLAELDNESRIEALVGVTASLTIDHSIAHKLLLKHFRPYESLDEILKEWPQSTTAFSEVKFIKPSNLADWQSTIYRCATMVKVFKTLDYHMSANTHQYNFVYQCKTLFRSTTHVFEYDPRNFSFVIRTGLGNGGQVFKNTPVTFYKQVLNQLHSLLEEMKKELPQTHYEQLFALHTLIKDKQRA